ncbi:MAG: hypothetical protein WB817_18675 [Terriglobales bacterium]
MGKGDPHHWLDLCKAATQTTNRDEFLKIIRELSEVLEHEQEERCDLPADSRTKPSTQEFQC